MTVTMPLGIPALSLVNDERYELAETMKLKSALDLRNTRFLQTA